MKIASILSIAVILLMACGPAPAVPTPMATPDLTELERKDIVIFWGGGKDFCVSTLQKVDFEIVRLPDKSSEIVHDINMWCSPVGEVSLGDNISSIDRVYTVLILENGEDFCVTSDIPVDMGVAIINDRQEVLSIRSGFGGTFMCAAAIITNEYPEYLENA